MGFLGTHCTLGLIWLRAWTPLQPVGTDDQANLSGGYQRSRLVLVSVIHNVVHESDIGQRNNHQRKVSTATRVQVWWTQVSPYGLLSFMGDEAEAVVHPPTGKLGRLGIGWRVLGMPWLRSNSTGNASQAGVQVGRKEIGRPASMSGGGLLAELCTNPAIHQAKSLSGPRLLPRPTG